MECMVLQTRSLKCEPQPPPEPVPVAVPEKPLTRRECKKLGLPKTRATAAAAGAGAGVKGGAGKIVIPGGRFEGTGEWQRNVTGRLDESLRSCSCERITSAAVLATVPAPLRLHAGDARTPKGGYMGVESLTIEDYHDTCFVHLSQSRTISISTSTAVNLVFLHLRISDFSASFKSGDVFNFTIKLCIWYPTAWAPWLSQANHIFCHLRMMSNFDDYGAASSCWTTKEPPGGSPAGFLFLCPRKDFKIGSSSFHWPDCPAYWSLDSSSVDRLTLEEATRLGFPALRLKTTLHGDSSDASIYEGLRRFHRAKGFNLDGLDIARNLGYPLYQLSSEDNFLFAHMDEGDFEVAEEDWNQAANVEGSHTEEDDHDSDSVRTACGSDHFAENQGEYQ
ncbi:hypothetical protein DFH08DRAFT_996544 [Mycena albidolilacea]|uniref:Uncharacterized protein n=1 Tax=Mycena albidolilacea TaxID=1033008 RepID=A0AAD6YXT9_9AGAR|nr:hypothetical protein DFH08DRAFT_996544 [Mycena albidolilacea]